MKLEHEFTMRAELGPQIPIGAGPIGTRIYVGVTGGTVEGERVRGTILGGGEWALMGPDGFARVDVRLQVETHDQAFLYVQYTGLLEMNEAVQRALQEGGATDYADQYFHTNPRIETGDERYAWLNSTFFVGEGHFAEGPAVEYRVWRPA